MQYTIDAERGILFQIEDDEADRVARIVEQRRAVAVEPEVLDLQPLISRQVSAQVAHSESAQFYFAPDQDEIPLVEAVAACQRISAEQHAALDDCECERIGVKKCGMCE